MPVAIPFCHLAAVPGHCRLSLRTADTCSVLPLEIQSVILIYSQACNSKVEIDIPLSNDP